MSHGSGRKIILMTGDGAEWVNPGAVLDLDFTNLRYFLGSGIVSSLITTARSSLAWMFDSSGVLREFTIDQPRILNGKGLMVEEARTNLFLNSDAPATQTIAVTNTTEYTISLWGSGSAVLSGALAGTATDGSPITGTTGSTSLTVTISGAPDYLNVEAGGFGTSPIITAGASVTRASDAITLTDVSWLTPQSCTLLIEFEQMAPGMGTQNLIRWSNVDWHRLRSGSILYGQVRDDLGNLILNKGFGSPPPTGIHSIALGLAVDDMAVAWSASLSGSKGIDTDLSGTPEASPAQISIGNNGGGGESLNGRLRRIVGWQTRKTDAELLTLVDPF